MVLYIPTMKKIVCGNTTLYEHYCPRCDESTLIGDQDFTCECGYTKNSDKISEVRIICESKRQSLPQKIKRAIVDRQSGLCYWCGRDIVSGYIIKRGNVIKLKIHYDHIVPFEYLQRNPLTNWCASCHICNLYKSSKTFNTEEEIKTYLSKKWKQAIDTGYIEDLADVIE